MHLSINLRHAPQWRKRMGACYLAIDVRYEKGGIVHRRKPISRYWNRQQTKYKDEKNSLTAWHVWRRGNRVNLKQMTMCPIRDLHFIHRVDVVRSQDSLPQR